MKAERDAWKDKFEKAFPPHDCVEIQEKYDAAAQWLHDCLGDSVREITETIQEQIAAKLAEKGKP
jgi:hypothetical protein